MSYLAHSDRPERCSKLSPAHALLTPTWLGALALLVANDHWLKGSGLIPGVLTGKLSDFAGMLVAPVLLAVLLGVRSRRALAACHLAVGLVFAGIQLSPAFAGLWSGVMGLVGHPWAITCDPTDLIALPFLLLSWHLLMPAMDGRVEAMTGARRSAVAYVSVLGLWATVATSDDGSYGDEEVGWGDETGGTGGGWEDVQGAVYIHNPNDFEISVTIRTLASGVNLDCDAIASDPGRLLSDDVFGEAEHWLMPPKTNVGVDFPLVCGAAKVGGEGVPEQILFSTAKLHYPENFPGSHEQIGELGSLGMAISMTGGQAEWIGGEHLRHTPTSETAPQPESCDPPKGENRVDWSWFGHGERVVEFVGSSVGPDGCHEIELLDAGQPSTWYLCSPAETLPFVAGEHYLISELFGNEMMAQLWNLDANAVAIDNDGQPRMTAIWARGATWMPDEFAVDVTPSECPWQVEEGCSTVERGVQLTLAEDIELIPGVPAAMVREGTLHELVLGRARQVALVDSNCPTVGADRPPYAFDYAVVSTPLP